MSLIVKNISGKWRYNRFRWFGHFKKRNNDKMVKKVGEIKL